MKRDRNVHRVEIVGDEKEEIVREEYGSPISIKDAVKRKMIVLPREEMQKLFSQTELEEMGYDYTKTEE